MKKKICFLVDSIFSFGGVQRVTAVIAKELAKEYDVTIITLDSPQQENKSLYGLDDALIDYRYFSYPKIRKWKYPFCKAISGVYLKTNILTKWASEIYAHSSFPSEQRKALLRELKQKEYDIIIGVHAPLAARLANLYNEFPKAKLFGWIHNSYEALFGENSLYIGRKRKRHYFYQFSKLGSVIVLSQFDALKYNQFDSRIYPIVIPNPLTIKPVKISTGTSKRFLAVGRLTPLHKGFDILIEAFRLFSYKNQEWCLDIVGEGPEKDKYESMITEYHLGNRIFIHPFTNNIEHYYSTAQIYVLSSRWEGFGLVLVEAMAHGLPIVTSSLPTSKEILGDFGIYFKNGDIIDLAFRLEESIKVDWQIKSQQAIKIAKNYDIKRIIKKWKTLFEC